MCSCGFLEFLGIIQSAEHFRADTTVETFKEQVIQECSRCGYMSSNSICKACILLEGLSKGKAKIALGKGFTKAKRPVDMPGSREDW